ncbi:MAG: NAD(P)/FAD-dependent oxidoreductase [Proteobacteria bacterium]|nr:NAD(P)/FAD-dependent oxidoreductase [Pseudomonadota bacterium]MBU1647893.1 NAD(P)/FAD-dependent oxidoreductase [Pseudomonadota bacterium]MBU1986845.1 NAD(P)/FAD-dependent oxidoreductase [Pseudomonadota bacterium]
MNKRKVIVIGGGAAGLMAAGQAAAAGADVLILEKMKRPGRKICITGKGRCNITNIAGIKEFIDHFGSNGRFLRQAFSRFFAPELMSFLEQQGLELVSERGGRVFPASGKAPDVVKVFQHWLQKNGVQIKTESRVELLLTTNGAVSGVLCKDEALGCDAVILATGGASYAATGSTGDGYRLAAAVGHTIIPIRPALVPLEIGGDLTALMDGLDLRNINVRLLKNGKRCRQAFGEMSFTKFGVTGPVILTLSGEVVDGLRRDDKMALSIDLKPALDEQKLEARLLRDLESRSKEPIHSLLRGLLPRVMIPVCLKLTEIPEDRLASQVTAKERKRLKSWLKDFRLEISGHRPFTEAIITAGGVDLKEVDPRTMESRKARGLYLAGEVLDIQGDTGGYNLQAAFSTGWLAGRAAALGPDAK